MGLECAAALEQAIQRVARRAFAPSALAQAHLVRGIRELSTRYTTAREAIHSSQLSPRELDPARLLFFTLADLPKVTYPLVELRAREAFAQRPGPLKVLDVGAGMGAELLGMLAVLDAPDAPDEIKIHVDALDLDSRALELLALVLEECRATVGLGRHATLHTQPCDLRRFAPSAGCSYELILVGNVLNELDPRARLPLVRQLLACLAPAGCLVLLEPALRETARELHLLRDQLLAAREAHVLAPCVHENPCPALAHPGDWCHERRIWQPPPGVRALAAVTGLRRRDLKWSYLALGHRALDPSTNLYRVISGPLRSKGKLEFFACTARGRERLVRLQRHRSPQNRPFEDLDRGWLVQFEEACQQEGGVQLQRDTRVLACDPATSDEPSS